ncbi:glycosyltransferase [Patiriisocius hiemis]|uniref:Glycosyltransferase family 2 protein n=1 Tax=Patiriisocius hiemis TaxID=3075604 RepID=A0ABU2YGA9_9FLAO|nr:glycosyltransferase family 2 protein [Constantimarinum sp. W242]MDT0556916.1 glycosyltransferase family 2 protein [Constantimarinum sp. W242]
MDIYIIIPAYNEEAHIKKTLQSLVSQTKPPKKIVVVDDNSTDKTPDIISEFATKYDFIFSEKINTVSNHEPGSKVVHAFKQGFKKLDHDYDIICKFDADLIFPTNYLETISNYFERNQKCGMAGGFCAIKKEGSWVIENLTNPDHIRGALKAYRKDCFKTIGGLKESMGWDTVDELLAKYHGWEVVTDTSLLVKHLKPTGGTYSKKAKYKQGEAFYKMRYGYKLTQLASLKLALKKKQFGYYFDCLRGFYKAKKEKATFIVTEEEGAFIRKYRWKNIKKKLL